MVALLPYRMSIYSESTPWTSGCRLRTKVTYKIMRVKKGYTYLAHTTITIAHFCLLRLANFFTALDMYVILQRVSF